MYLVPLLVAPMGTGLDSTVMARALYLFDCHDVIFTASRSSSLLYYEIRQFFLYDYELYFDYQCFLLAS